MKKILSVFLAGILAFSMAACSGKPAETQAPETQAPETQAQGETQATVEQSVAETVAETVGTEGGSGYTIGFSPYTLTNEYFTAVLNGCQTACDELGCELIYYDPQNDPTKQADQINDMIAAGIDALVYIPYDSAGAQTVLQACKDAGVKVINIDNVVARIMSW